MVIQKVPHYCGSHSRGGVAPVPLDKPLIALASDSCPFLQCCCTGTVCCHYFFVFVFFGAVNSYCNRAVSIFGFFGQQQPVTQIRLVASPVWCGKAGGELPPFLLFFSCDSLH